MAEIFNYFREGWIMGSGFGELRRKALFAVTLSLIAGCCQGPVKICTVDEYANTVKSAGEMIPIAVQMEEVYGSVDHFIIHFGSGRGPRKWHTVAYFGGRYELTMEVQVLIDYDGEKIVKVIDEPKFYLVEWDQIQVLPDGRHSALSSNRTPSSHKPFGPLEWSRIYKANGDLGAMGFEMNTTPIEHFNEYTTANLRTSLGVSLLQR